MNSGGSFNWKRPGVMALAVLVGAAFCPSHDFGRPTDEPGPGDYRISVDVGLVVLPVFVTNHKGRAVSGLGERDFQVYDNGRPQQISLFEAEDVPVTVGLVVDNSGSMRPKRPEVIAAAEQFAKSSNPEDQMFVVNFNDTVSMGLPPGVAFTGNVQLLSAALSDHPAVGNTALYDGVAVALRHIKAGTTGRKALIVISDGDDNSSEISLAQILNRAQASGVQIYALGVYDGLHKDENPEVLRQLAKVTGGKAYFPPTPSQMTQICRQIAQDLRHQYTIGYHPSNPEQSSSYHTVRVTATASGTGKLHVSTRPGYVMSEAPNAG